MRKTVSILTIVILFVILGLTIVKISNSTKKRPDAQVGNAVTDPPKIVSTKPDPLEDAIVAADGAVEITFNRSLENVGEFKSKIEPEIKYRVELSGDRKTAKIIPEKPYELGATYTLFIGPETKFDGVGNWGQEKIFHFRTIKYTGV